MRINANLHEWFKSYAQRINTAMSALVTEYIDSLRHPKATPTDIPDKYTAQQLERAELQRHSELAEERTYEIKRLEAQASEKDLQLAHRDDQIDSLTQEIDHLTQLLALKGKNVVGLTGELVSCRRRIEDTRRPWWQRLLRR